MLGITFKLNHTADINRRNLLKCFAMIGKETTSTTLDYTIPFPLTFPPGCLICNKVKILKMFSGPH